MPSEWLQPQAASAWLQEHAPEVSVRHNGGFLVEVDARDPWAAVEVASDKIESLSARVTVGLPGQPAFEPADLAAVAGSKHEFPLGRPRRQVDVHSLHRQNVLFSIDEPGLEGRLRSAVGGHEILRVGGHETAR